MLLLTTIESFNSKNYYINSFNDLKEKINEVNIPAFIYLKDYYNRVFLGGFVIPASKNNYNIIFNEKALNLLNIDILNVSRVKRPLKLLNYINSDKFINRLQNKLFNRYSFSFYKNMFNDRVNIKDADVLNEFRIKEKFNLVSKNIKSFKLKELYCYSVKSDLFDTMKFYNVKYKDVINDVEGWLKSISKNCLSTNVYKIIKNKKIVGIAVKEFDKISLLVCINNDEDMYKFESLLYNFGYHSIYSYSRMYIANNNLNLKYYSNFVLPEVRDIGKFINNFMHKFNIVKYKFLDKVLNMNKNETLITGIYFY